MFIVACRPHGHGAMIMQGTLLSRFRCRIQKILHCPPRRVEDRVGHLDHILHEHRAVMTYLRASVAAPQVQPLLGLQVTT